MAVGRSLLADHRTRRGFSQERLAQAIGVSTGTVAHWERGDYRPRARYRPALADALGVGAAELGLILGDVEPEVEVGVPEWLSLFAAAERAAAAVWVFEPVVVPALLQTPEYAAAVQRLGPGSCSDAALERRVAQRMGRQRVLERDPPVVLRAIVDASVLDRCVGGPRVMDAQLAHLGAMSRLPNVDVRVVSGSASVAASFGAFMLLCPVGGGPLLACNDGLVQIGYHEGAGDVAAHAAVFEHLWSGASDEGESLGLIRGAREALW